VVLLPETDPTGAYVLAEKIRQEVAEMRVPVAGSAIQPSVSIGVVGYPEDGRTTDELLITADSSMYRSKRSGKNRVSGVEVPDGEVGEPVFDPGAGGVPTLAAVPDPTPLPTGPKASPPAAARPRKRGGQSV